MSIEAPGVLTNENDPADCGCSGDSGSSRPRHSVSPPRLQACLSQPPCCCLVQESPVFISNDFVNRSLPNSESRVREGSSHKKIGASGLLHIRADFFVNKLAAD